jgi:hypothetical protein
MASFSTAERLLRLNCGLLWFGQRKEGQGRNAVDCGDSNGPGLIGRRRNAQLAAAVFTPAVQAAIVCNGQAVGSAGGNGIPSGDTLGLLHEDRIGL